MNTDVDASDSMGRTALCWAVRRGNVPAVKLLLRAGSDPNVTDKFGNSLLSCSTSYNCTKLLLDAGADIKRLNSHGDTPLFHAYRSRSARESTRALIAAGMSVNWRRSNWSTPIHSAAERGCVPMSEVLLEHGADVHALDDNKQNPLIYAQESHLDTDEVTRLLLALGADYTLPDKFGWTILHHAARLGTLRLLDILADAGLSMDIRAVNHDGETALQIAQRRSTAPDGFLEAFQTLLSEIRARTMHPRNITTEDSEL